MITKGPGVAVRAPPGTKYRVYGLVVKSGSQSSAREDRSVYIANPGPLLDSPAAASNGLMTVSEYDRTLAMVLDMPLGASTEERGSVRGFAWAQPVPPAARPGMWRLLCGYVPCGQGVSARQRAELQRKRDEYAKYVANYYKISITDFIQSNAQQNQIQKPTMLSSSWMSGMSKREEGTSCAAMMPPYERAILSQIALDIPRHSYALFHVPELASALARCLFLWSLRYPAVGYVQGIDDIMVVFFFVFLEDAVLEYNMNIQRQREKRQETEDSTLDDHVIPPTVVFTHDVGQLSDALKHLPVDFFKSAEADTYWCGGFFLSWLQENFTPGQSGILRSLTIVERLLGRADQELLSAITSHGVTLMDCCLQWVHCLLARELPLEIIIILWDRYLAIGNSELVLDYHAYVCGALLIHIRQEVVGKSVDVVIQCLKDPLNLKRTTDQQKQQANKQRQESTMYNRRWIEEIIENASTLYREYPLASLM